MEEKIKAVVLAAGQGKRMNSRIRKQYLLLKDKPVLYYSLKAFEDSFVDEIILVTGRGEIPYCEKELVEKYNFHKIGNIVEGGKERYHSVYQGILAAGNCDYIMIHDGARPFIDQELLNRMRDGVRRYQACVAAMPVKDTIRIADQESFALRTPDRSRVWMIQTPQTFSGPLIREAYARLMEEEEALLARGYVITDDAMAVEAFSNVRVKLIEGSYRNIKITTPDDLLIGENLLSE